MTGEAVRRFTHCAMSPSLIFKFEIIIKCRIALPDSFEYQCHGSTAIRNISTLSVRGPSLYVYGRQILTYKDEGVNLSGNPMTGH